MYHFFDQTAYEDPYFLKDQKVEDFDPFSKRR